MKKSLTSHVAWPWLACMTSVLVVGAGFVTSSAVLVVALSPVPLLFAVVGWSARQKSGAAERWWCAALFAAAVVLADWWFDLWAGCRDCSLRQEQSWFGVPLQVPALALLIVWLGASRWPLVRAFGSAALIAGVAVASTLLISNGWWCLACISAYVAILLAVFLCPIGWREYWRHASVVATISAAIFYLGLRHMSPKAEVSTVDALSHLQITDHDKQMLADFLTLGTNAEAPVVVLDFDWTCARCRSLVPKIIDHAAVDYQAGVVQLRLRPHRGQHSLAQQLYDVSLGAATLGELPAFIAAARTIRDESALDDPIFSRWREKSRSLATAAFAMSERENALVEIGARSLPVLSGAGSIDSLSILPAADWDRMIERIQD